MTKANVTITTELRTPSELGVHHRFVCMTGPNKGKVYYLLGQRILIGRGEKSDIQIFDSKISREHAELTLVNKVYTISDLSNQNGIIINDAKVTQGKLLDGQKIIIGQTVIKYNIIEVLEEKNEIVEVIDGKQVLVKKESKVKPVKPKQKIDDELDSNFDSTAAKKAEKGNNKVIILIAFLGVIVFVFMGGDDNSSKFKKTKSSTEKEFDLESESSNSKKGIGKEDPEVKRKFDMLIHSGRREFREANYFRAMEEFRRADLLIPGSGMAGFLMSRAKQRLDEDVTKNFDKANKDLDAKKYQSAINSLCGVLQLLQKYPEDERYKNGEEKLHALEVELIMEKGEIKCFEEKPADSKN